jgi:AcrR family transcriptional regulator
MLLLSHGELEQMTTSAPRKRGRPPGKAFDTRERLLAATRIVYGQRGIHSTTVEMILEEAGVSRPTFYKYFASAREAIELVVVSMNDDVEALLAKIFTTEQKRYYDYLPMVLSGYLNWGRAQGTLMQARFRELHDTTSPVCTHRTAHNLRIMNMIATMMIGHGAPRPSDVALSSLVHSIEFLGYQFCVAADHSEMPIYMQVMARNAFAMLGTREDWEAAMDDAFYARLLGLERA